MNSLLNNSPFGSAQTNSTATQSDKPLEFRGVFAEGGEYFFNLYIAAHSRSEWLGMDEVYGENLTVKSYDADNHLLTVDYQGKPLTLTLGAAKRIAGPAATAQPAVGQPAAPAVQPAPPVSEQERLSRIAEEIRRRRALRQQALQKKP